MLKGWEMAKVRKRYNPLKQAVHLKSALFKNQGLFRSLNLHKEGHILIDFRKRKEIDMTPTKFKLMDRARNDWVIHIGVVANNGFNFYVKNGIVREKDKTISQIENSLDEKIRNFAKKEVSKMQLHDVCWLAIPTGVELDEQEFGEIIDGFGVME